MKHCFCKALMLMAFLIGISFQAKAQGANVCLIVTTTDGEEQTLQLSEESHLYFDNGETLVIEDGTGVNMTFDLSKIRKIVCSEMTGLQESATSQLQLLPNPSRGLFVVKNLAESCQARMYSLDGRLVKSFEAQDGSVVDISDLAKGMYMLSINGQTLKLMKL